ncbi:MAG: hypothetical protein AAGI17_10525 [Planctomycetota bacterium]
MRQANLTRATLTAAALIGLSGCVAFDLGPQNPGWSMTAAEERAEFERMKAEPVELERPLVIIGGYLSPPMVADSYGKQISRLTGEDMGDLIRVPMIGVQTFEQAVEVVLDALYKRYPQVENGETIEVDVIGISMGGIVAMQAAEPADDRPRLKIRRLYTLGSPHRGADLAQKITLEQISQDMRYKSLRLVKLHENRDKWGYELYPYAILDDNIVGTRNSAPWGEAPIWVQRHTFVTHFGLEHDDQILIDVARRLRGEEPILVRAPLPEDSDEVASAAVE